MSSISTIFDIATIIISTLLLIINIKNFKNGSRYLIYLITFTIYIIPLYIDYFYRTPEYNFFFYGFIESREDALTSIVFDIFMLFFQYRLLYAKNSYLNNKITTNTLFYFNKKEKKLLYVGMTLSALVVVFIIRKPFLLYTFGWRELGLIDLPRYYDYAEMLCYFSSSCSLLLLFDKRSRIVSVQKLLAALFLYFSLSIQGKRAILFFAIICIAILLYFDLINRVKDKQRSAKFYGFFIGVLLALSSWYMFSLSVSVHETRHNKSYDDTSAMVTTQRIDFFRDDRVRMAIYSELYPEKLRILEYPGQTIIPDIFAIVPLNYLRDRIGVGRKVYQTYFTCALSRTNIDDPRVLADSNWMTVTYIAEIISNIGIILAFVLIPYLCLRFSSFVDKLKYPFNLFSIFAFTLLNLFDTTYVVFYIELVVIFAYISKKPRSKAII